MNECACANCVTSSAPAAAAVEPNNFCIVALLLLVARTRTRTTARSLVHTASLPHQTDAWSTVSAQQRFGPCTGHASRAPVHRARLQTTTGRPSSRAARFAPYAQASLEERGAGSAATATADRCTTNARLASLCAFATGATPAREGLSQA